MINSRSGFSLVEILVVVVIMAILGTVVIVSIQDPVDDAKTNATIANISALKTGINKYQLDNGSYPTQRQGLQALIVPTTLPPLPKKFPEGGYIQSNNLPLDGWGQPFQYLVPGRTGQPFEIFSLGKDGKLGGDGHDADLSSSD